MAGSLGWLLAEDLNPCSHGTLYVIFLHELVWASLKHGGWVPRVSVLRERES